jgi:hypothetical protein
MKRYTPDHLTAKCWPTHCPDVFYDGTEAVIVGSDATVKALGLGASMSTTEFAIRIDRAYLLDLARKIMDEENSRNPLGNQEDAPWETSSISPAPQS